MVKKKVCLVGSFAVGKTSLVSRFVQGVFSDKYLTTIGVKIDKRVVSTGAGEVSLMLWDMAGEERFSHLRTSYLRGASGLIYVADGTRADTLEQATEYAERVAETEPDTPAVMLVNKADLESEWDVGGESEIAAKAGDIPFFTTSAKTGDNVEEAFVTLCERMLSNDG